jgi:hypothetical protein
MIRDLLRAIACLFGRHRAEETITHESGAKLERCSCGYTTFTDG